mmetsp:Transcript_5983/g.14578  ORF Transcript_5983/g.14578 Transcript_5983/m.14578 type:complete len:203 (-) Transcript_5983:668-1276(-)
MPCGTLRRSLPLRSRVLRHSLIPRHNILRSPVVPCDIAQRLAFHCLRLVWQPPRSCSTLALPPPHAAEIEELYLGPHRLGIHERAHHILSVPHGRNDPTRWQVAVTRPALPRQKLVCQRPHDLTVYLIVKHDVTLGALGVACFQQRPHLVSSVGCIPVPSGAVQAGRCTPDRLLPHQVRRARLAIAVHPLDEDRVCHGAEVF